MLYFRGAFMQCMTCTHIWPLTLSFLMQFFAHIVINKHHHRQRSNVLIGSAGDICRRSGTSYVIFRKAYCFMLHPCVAYWMSNAMNISRYKIQAHSEGYWQSVAYLFANAIEMFELLISELGCFSSFLWCSDFCCFDIFQVCCSDFLSFPVLISS